MKKIIFLLFTLCLITCGKKKKDFKEKENNTVTKRVTAVQQGGITQKKLFYLS